MSDRHDPRVDAYIAAATPFAREVLTHLRDVVLKAAPDLIETIKWNVPHYTWNGRNIVGLAGFKAHASMAFHRGDELGLGLPGDKGGMGHYGKLTRWEDVPSDRSLTAKVQAAVALEQAGPRPAKPKPRAPKATMPTPDDLTAALKSNAEAHQQWDAFAPSHKREYIGWITSAKRDDTRARRVVQAVAWIAEGKQRNWKYQNR